jgi:hypothetical protein
MSEIIVLLICAFLIVLGVAVEKWLVKTGTVRDKTYLVIVVAIASVLIKQTWYQAISWQCFLPLAILAMILGANRGDLLTTLKRGRWWWKVSA